MKFGVREICDVVLKAKAPQKIGNKVFYANEPVLYFDTLKTSTMEGAATTVYAQGGRGNARLMAWEGERTVTFTMEDALISPEGFMILSGAGLIEAGKKDEGGTPIYQHITERVNKADMYEENGVMRVPVSKKPHLPYTTGDGGDGNFAFVMLVKNDEIISEPIIPDQAGNEEGAGYYLELINHENYDVVSGEGTDDQYSIGYTLEAMDFDSVIVDYYTARESDAMQIEITADKFGGNYYLEASTLFRDTNGVDMPAEFIIPNCKVQSNFTFSMASSGDPSTFTFTMDAFPDYTRFDKSKKVLAAIQVIKGADSQDLYRKVSPSEDHDIIFG
jgi:hypothetical protein